MTDCNSFFSEARMSEFRKLSAQYKISPEKLCLLDFQLSQELFFLLRAFEIFLRNKLDRQIAQCYKNDDWINLVNWGKDQQNRIDKAKDFYANSRISPSSEQIKCRLPLGFWCDIFHNLYHFDLWVNAKLSGLFAIRTKRDRIFSRMRSLSHLRNSVMHCRILIKNRILLGYKYLILMSVIKWLDADFYAWCLSMTDFGTTYKELLCSGN